MSTKLPLTREFQGFGCIENLGIYDDAFVPQPTVMSGIRNLYVGSPEAIEQHEKTHFATAEELPGYSDLSARTTEEIMKQRYNLLYRENAKPGTNGKNVFRILRGKSVRPRGAVFGYDGSN